MDEATIQVQLVLEHCTKRDVRCSLFVFRNLLLEVLIRGLFSLRFLRVARRFYDTTTRSSPRKPRELTGRDQTGRPMQVCELTRSLGKVHPAYGVKGSPLQAAAAPGRAGHTSAYLLRADAGGYPYHREGRSHLAQPAPGTCRRPPYPYPYP